MITSKSPSPPPLVAMTTQPSNESELQLYRVLQRANLLAYYDIFICQGTCFELAPASQCGTAWRPPLPVPDHQQITSTEVRSLGGDDLQQLCDAGEEEFLEIMQLVGMTNKPLHVRRLQKALQEWVTNPGKAPVLS